MSVCAGFSNVQGNIYKGMRWSTAHAYLRPAMERPNLDVAIKANVKRVRRFISLLIVNHFCKLIPFYGQVPM